MSHLLHCSAFNVISALAVREYTKYETKCINILNFLLHRTKIIRFFLDLKMTADKTVLKRDFAQNLHTQVLKSSYVTSPLYHSP